MVLVVVSLVLAVSTEVRVLIGSAAGMVLAGFALALIVELVARRSSDAVTDAVFAPVEATEGAVAPIVGRLLALAALVKSLRR
jgi:hypothetical protein